MSSHVYGELVPVGGGDPIPLNRTTMTVGRRESCDICLKYPNVSGTHCELTFQDGYWMIRDLGSSNGVKVNGERTTRKVLQPRDEVSISAHKYTIQYELGSRAKLEEMLAEEEDVFSQSLMEKAGLERSEKRPGRRG
jgi:pSer/pThr/pTyr-binding forkhead associated (FHA) protein